MLHDLDQRSRLQLCGAGIQMDATDGLSRRSAGGKGFDHGLRINAPEFPCLEERNRQERRIFERIELQRFWTTKDSIHEIPVQIASLVMMPRQLSCPFGQDR